MLRSNAVAMLIGTTCFLGVACVSQIASAAELRAEASRVDVHTGDEITVSVLAASDEPINAVEGELSFSSGVFDVVQIIEGGSSINFWIEHPHVAESGKIVFSGITPGGFTTPTSKLFSVVFVAVSDGAANFSLDGVHALKNDGVGTETHITTHDAYVRVRPGKSNTEVEHLLDKDPPEYFMPIVVTDSNLSLGEHTLVFSTQDKLSGVREYRVREVRIPLIAFLYPWVHAESPYPLTDQTLRSRIDVQAVDALGNVRSVTLAPAVDDSPLWWHTAGILGVFVLCIVALAVIFRKHFLQPRF